MLQHITTITRGTLLLSSLALCQPACSQSKTVEVADPRPVAKAVQMIEAIYGVPIYYEDPITVHPSQLEDVTEQVQRTPDPSHRVIVQKRSTLSFTYRPPVAGPSTVSGRSRTQAETETEVADALSSVLEGYAVGVAQ